MAPLLFGRAPFALGLPLLLIVGIRPRHRQVRRAPPRAAPAAARRPRRVRRHARPSIVPLVPAPEPHRRRPTRRCCAWAEQHTRPDSLLGTAPIRLEYVAVPLTVWPAVGRPRVPRRGRPTGLRPGGGHRCGPQPPEGRHRGHPRGDLHLLDRAGRRPVEHRAALGERFDPERDHVICVCAVGYRSRFIPLLIRADERQMHRRLPLERLFFADDDLTRSVDVTVRAVQRVRRAATRCASGRRRPTTARPREPWCRVGMSSSGSTSPRRPLRATTHRGAGHLGRDWEAGCQALGVHGRTKVLSPGDRAMSDAPSVPRYGASWLRDDGPGTEKSASPPDSPPDSPPVSPPYEPPASGPAAPRRR